MFHNSAWYLTSQRTKEVYTSPQLGKPWTKFADINVPVPSGMVSLQSLLGAPHAILLAVPPWYLHAICARCLCTQIPEDPFMYA